MAERMVFTPGSWLRLSPWAMVDFALKAILKWLQVLILAGISAWFGSTRMGSAGWPLFLPVAVIGVALIGSVLRYIFYRYRVVEDAIQVRRGALFRQHLNLPFERIQNISIEEPVLFRLLGLVTLKIDGAGSSGEEVNVAALGRSDADAMREYILRRKKHASAAPGPADAAAPDASAAGSEEAFFSRSLTDLVVHGLTNNRSFIAIAAILGLLTQSGLSPVQILQRLGIEFDVVVAGLSLVRLVVLAVLSFIAAVGVIALLSVFVSIMSYYGFRLYRTGDGLAIRRGLLTRHEIHVKKSRIQSIHLRQDWLDRLLGRYNVILERITHLPAPGHSAAAQTRRILVPSVRTDEVAIITDEILPGCRPASLVFTPIDRRYFRKYAAIVSAFYLPMVSIIIIGVFARSLSIVNPVLAGICIVWALHVLLLHLHCKAYGLAIDGDIVIARSGAIGIDYRSFPVDKIQNVTQLQSLLMRRHAVSSLRMKTASTLVAVPYLPTEFVRKVLDYCLFRSESTARSWM